MHIHIDGTDWGYRRSRQHGTHGICDRTNRSGGCDGRYRACGRGNRPNGCCGRDRRDRADRSDGTIA